MLWNGSLFILVFCCIFPVPFQALAAAWGSLGSAGWPCPTLPALPGLQVALGLFVGQLQHLCMFISQSVPWGLAQTAVLALWGRFHPPFLSAEGQSLAVGDGRTAVSPKDKHPAKIDRIFFFLKWLVANIKFRVFRMFNRCS